MPTRDITDCMERLRCLQQCLAAIIESPAYVDMGAVTFLTVELRQAIDDLDNHLPNANELKPEAIKRVTSVPEEREGEG